MANSIDFSNTQRIVLFIDLTPLLQNPNPNSYLKSILIASKSLLSFNSLSSSLFAFRFFFSSLSPLRSSSILHRINTNSSSTSLSFNRPDQTLPSLSKTLISLSTSELSAELSPSSPCASYVAGSLLQLVHDYAWESQIENQSGSDCNFFPVVRSNLIVLFSPVSRSLKCLSEFMNFDVADEFLRSKDGFCSKFRFFFGAVNDAFVSRDIHFSWIDVECEIECNEERVEIDQLGSKLGLFEDGIRILGWGFCSTNLIVLGSAVVPFGLIYPMFGINFSYLNYTKMRKSIRAPLSLQISDVSGKPLECKCCDLELLNLKMSPRLKPDAIMHTMEFGNSESEGFDPDETFWGQFGNGTVTIRVKELHRYFEILENKEGSSSHFLVRVSPCTSEKNRKKTVDDFYANRVIDLLSREMGEFSQRDNLPIWQILMSFLYREGYWALVCLEGRDGQVVLNNIGNSCTGILKPFTAHLALLSIIDDGQIVGKDLGESKLAKTNNLICKPDIDVNNSTGFGDSQTLNSSSGNNALLVDGKRKKNKKHVHEDLSWSSFCKAAFECCSHLNLEEVYFAKESNKSKKLKFLKCWMKQIQKPSYHHLTIPDASYSHQHIAVEIDERQNGTQQENEQPISPNVSFEPSRMQNGDAFVSCSETSEAFFCNLPKKIQQGLESEGADLQILAERLVTSSIHWLHEKCETSNVLGSQTPMAKSEDSVGKIVAAELVKRLTKEPKELKEKRKHNSLSSQASDTFSTSDNIVKEYEMQILLRMEILRSEIRKSIAESTEQKLVKQICSFLEIIQYLVDGGFHGPVSLYDYVERNIKPRYSHTLAKVIDKICAQMDLLPFGEENESQVLLLNSEDSNQSWRDKLDRYEPTESNKIYQSLSTEEKSSKSLEENLQEIMREEHTCKLSQARERRERAKRFVSFTSWVPDLQRVWAPKQPKPMRSKSESLKKESKRKERRRASYSVVCETPMTGNKRMCSRSSIGDDKELDHGSQNSSASISKALFQGDHW